MHIGPQDYAPHPDDGVQQMMMVVPIDRDIHKAEHIAEKHRHQPAERTPIGALRHLQFQHHDRDDDGDNAVAESRQTVSWHRDSRSWSVGVYRAILAYSEL